MWKIEQGRLRDVELKGACFVFDAAIDLVSLVSCALENLPSLLRLWTLIMKTRAPTPPFAS